MSRVVQNEHLDLDPDLCSFPTADTPSLDQAWMVDDVPQATGESSSHPLFSLIYPFDRPVRSAEHEKYRASEGPSRGHMSASPSSTFVGTAGSIRFSPSMDLSPVSASRTPVGDGRPAVVGARSASVDKEPVKDELPRPFPGVLGQLEPARPNFVGDAAPIRLDGYLSSGMDDEFVPINEEIARHSSPRPVPRSADNGRRTSIAPPKNVAEPVHGSQDAPLDDDAMPGVEMTHEDDEAMSGIETTHKGNMSSGDKEAAQESPLFSPDNSMSIDSDGGGSGLARLALPGVGEPCRDPSEVLAESLARAAEDAEGEDDDMDMDDEFYVDATDSLPEADQGLSSSFSAVEDEEFHDVSDEGYDADVSFFSETALSPDDTFDVPHNSPDTRSVMDSSPILAALDSAADVDPIDPSTDDTSIDSSPMFDTTHLSSRSDPDSSSGGANGGPLGDPDQDADGSTDDGEWEYPQPGSEDAEGEADDGLDEGPDDDMPAPIDASEAAQDQKRASEREAEAYHPSTKYVRASTIDSGFDESEVYEAIALARAAPESSSKVDEGIDDPGFCPSSAAAGNENVFDRPSTPVRHGNHTHEYQYHSPSENACNTIPCSPSLQGLSLVMSTQDPSPLKKSPHASRRLRLSPEQRAPLLPTQGRPDSPAFRDNSRLPEDPCSYPSGYGKHYPKEHQADENQPVLPRTH